MLTLVCAGTPGPRCGETLEYALADHEVEVVTRFDPGTPLQDRRILFAVPLDETGINHDFYDLLSVLRTHPDYLAGSMGGVFIDGRGDLYTKSAARELVLAANRAGCAFVGRPLVEGTGSLGNFAVQAKNGGCSLEEAYRRAAADLANRVEAFTPPKTQRPRLAVFHASSYGPSNTLDLWRRVHKDLDMHCDVTETGLRNGTLEDCAGCPYTMCLHFGEKGECFYGGVMVREVYPAIREADGVVLLCPNYNDALSANLTACINRLTALYRTTDFTGKALFGIVVSGYSGGDIVAQQLVSALCMNKGFWLPPHFCLLETANNAGTAVQLEGIGERLAEFTENILRQLKP